MLLPFLLIKLACSPELNSIYPKVPLLVEAAQLIPTSDIFIYFHFTLHYLQEDFRQVLPYTRCDAGQLELEPEQRLQQSK